MNGLSVSRAEDRETMASLVVAAAQANGWKHEIHAYPTARMIVVPMQGPQGLSVYICLDGGDAQQREGTWVVSWFIRDNESTMLQKHAFQSVNEYHYRKATDICEGFDQLLWLLNRRMSQANRGVLFQAHNDEERSAA